MKKLFLFMLSILMVFSVAGCNAPPKMGSGNKVIATSGSDKILLRDFLYTLGSYRTQNEAYFNQLMELSSEDFKEYWNAESYQTEGNTMFDDLKNYAWESTKEIAILYKVATERGFKFDPEEIKTVEENLAAATVSMNTEQKTGDRIFYENYYVTKEEALEVAKIINTTEMLEKSITDGIEISDSEIKTYFEDPANIYDFEDLQQVTIAHILIEVAEDATEEQKNEARQLAEDLKARVEAGEDFGALAEEYSTDGGSNTNKGQYTITRNENFVTEFMDWTFSANVGDYGIVETSYGFHVMNLVNVESIDDMIARDAEALKARVVERRLNAELDKIIAENPMEWVLNETLYKGILPDVYGTPYEGRTVEPTASPVESK